MLCIMVGETRGLRLIIDPTRVLLPSFILHGTLLLKE